MEEHSTHTEKVTVTHDVPKGNAQSGHKNHSNSEHKSQSHAKQAASSSATGISELKKPFWQYLSGALAILLVIVLFGQYDIEITKTNGVAIDEAAVVDDGAAAVGNVAYVASDYYDESDPFIGDVDAPVTIVEFSDFQCPFCARFYDDAYQSIKDEYLESGQVKIVFRDFPLSFHPEAEPAALAAECAHEQGMFWEFHDLIFENQDILSSSAYLEWAEDLGLDVGDFSTCIEEGRYLSEIATDYNDGGRLGITGTPGFFVNGELVTGAQPYSVFQAEIEAALQG